MHTIVRTTQSVLAAAALLVMVNACSSDKATAPQSLSLQTHAVHSGISRSVYYSPGATTLSDGEGTYYGHTQVYTGPAAPSNRSITYTAATGCYSCSQGAEFGVTMDVYNKGDGTTLTDEVFYPNGIGFAVVSRDYPVTGPALYRLAKTSHYIGDHTGGHYMYTYADGTL